MTHSELCLLTAKRVRNRTKPRLIQFNIPKYVVVELVRSNIEEPDVFCWGGGVYTMLFEIKLSHSDFIADKKKYFRQNPEEGLGTYRSYVCPVGIIKEQEIPDKWGLYYVDDNNNFECIKQPEKQKASSYNEVDLISAIMRRENIKSQIFNYKSNKYEH